MLEIYGWSETLRQQFQSFAAEGLKPGRVIVHQRGPYRIVTDEGHRLSHEIEALRRPAN